MRIKERIRANINASNNNNAANDNDTKCIFDNNTVHNNTYNDLMILLVQIIKEIFLLHSNQRDNGFLLTVFGSQHVILYVGADDLHYKKAA